MTSLSDISPLLVPIIALLIPIVAIIASVTLKLTRLHLLHETVRQLTAAGKPIPPELLNKIIDGK
jgi:hypothetical protein